MPVDRSRGGFLDRAIQIAIARASESGDTSKRLLEAGFPGPAYVWAVRSVEIYFKEVVLLPSYLEEFDGDWERSWREVAALFGSGKWSRARRRLNHVYGQMEPMITEDGQDVWDVWDSVVVKHRGDIVHGRAEPTAEEAMVVVAWQEQLRLQMTMRLITSRHPLHDLFVAAIETARAERDIGSK
jgi:hypothetical protein